MSSFLNLSAKSSLVPTPSVQETRTGSVILIFVKSKIEAKPPMLFNEEFFFSFWTLLLVNFEICLTNLFPREILTPLFL